jgi:glycerol 2-dehydrogenase (NADP+)
VYLVHWPVALNPDGNHPVFPTRPNGSRDVDESRDLKETWKDMEALVKNGEAKGLDRQVNMWNLGSRTSQAK